jgi:hypothetical protein
VEWKWYAPLVLRQVHVEVEERLRCLQRSRADALDVLGGEQGEERRIRRRVGARSLCRGDRGLPGKLADLPRLVEREVGQVEADLAVMTGLDGAVASEVDGTSDGGLWGIE